MRRSGAYARGGRTAHDASPAPGGAKRAHPLVRLQQSLGNAAVQAKLRVGAPNDRWEREADHIAGQVSGVSATEPKSAAAAPEPVASASAIPSSGGSPIPGAVRQDLENRLGYDLGSVRVHSGQQAAGLASNLEARAYTIGRDIVFNQGEYQPESQQGKHLLAHEVVHVLQQGSAAPAPDVQRDDWGATARRYGRRAWRAGERAVDRASDLADRAREAADRYGSEAAESAERWWNSGTGDVQRITFDGSTVTLHGTVTYSAPALSGLMPIHPSAAGVDYTDPIYQDVADKGPLPAGDYYLDPRESESNPPGAFNPTAWGRYRTPLHETTITAISRRVTTSRSGGFYLHQDANHNGTAGCIGVVSTADNREIHRLIRANTQRIPVEVAYTARTPASAPTTVTPDAGAVRRKPLEVTPVHAGMVQRDPPPAPVPLHYLVQAGITRLRSDSTRYGGTFPRSYYDELSRALFEVALAHTHNYREAFRMMDDLCDGDLGFQLQREYTRLVGTDTANGWDKMRHFNYTAWLQYAYGGVIAPEAFTYGKELLDELESWVGADPEGYSVPDIRADNRGEAFAEEMEAREIRERPPRGPMITPPGLFTPPGAGGGFGGLMERDRRRAFGR